MYAQREGGRQNHELNWLSLESTEKGEIVWEEILFYLELLSVYGIAISHLGYCFPINSIHQLGNAFFPLKIKYWPLYNG